MRNRKAFEVCFDKEIFLHKISVSLKPTLEETRQAEIQLIEEKEERNVIH
jgi:hypothetical protein